MNSRLLLAFALSCVPGLVACGGDGGNSTLDSANTIAARTTGPTQEPATPNTTVEPALPGPASQYTVLLEDVGPRWYTDIPGVYEFDDQGYADGQTFTSPAEGMKLLRQWGYREGYETSLVPEGRMTAILNGSFSFKVETHLFESQSGAQRAYEWFRAAVQRNAQPETVGSVGNDWSGWSLITSKIGNSDVEGVFHQVMFRRGNLVVIVQTYGSSKFMTVADAFALAQIADLKATGTVEAIPPTPTSNFTPEVAGTPVQRLTPVTGLTPEPHRTPTP